MRGLLSWLPFIGLCVVLVTLVRTSRAPTPDDAAPQPPQPGVLAKVIPAAVPLLLLTACVLLFLGSIRRAGVPYYTPRYTRVTQLQRRMILLSLFSFIAAIALLGTLAFSWTPGVRSAALSTVLTQTAVWVLWVIVLMIACIRMFRSSLGDMGHEESTSRLPQVVLVNDDGVRTMTEHVDALARWSYIVSYVETEHLYLLYNRDLVVSVLPKRALPDPAAHDAFRALVAGKVAAGRFLNFPSSASPVPLEYASRTNPAGPS